MEFVVVGTVAHTGLVGPAAVAVVMAAHRSEQEEAEVEMVRQFPCGKTAVIGVSLASAGWGTFPAQFSQVLLWIYAAEPVVDQPSLALQWETDFLYAVGGEWMLRHDVWAVAWAHNGQCVPLAVAD